LGAVKPFKGFSDTSLLLTEKFFIPDKISLLKEKMAKTAVFKVRNHRILF